MINLRDCKVRLSQTYFESAIGKKQFPTWLYFVPTFSIYWYQSWLKIAEYKLQRPLRYVASIISPIPAPNFSLEDCHAISFLQHTFSKMKSIGGHDWSVHGIFFRHVMASEMAMHFLLAVSHHEMCLFKKSTKSFPPRARAHYKLGAQLLYQSMTKTSHFSHVNVSISFLYIYMFWMRSDELQPRWLEQLSMGVYNYCQGHGLLKTLCDSAPGDQPVDHNKTSKLETYTSENVIVSRLRFYLYDRDTYCSLVSCGGALASFINQNSRARDLLWKRSKLLTGF